MKVFKTVLMAAACVVAAGCGRDTSRFTGTYNTTGTMTISQGNQSVTRESAASSIEVIEGHNSDLVLISGTCQIPFDIDGEVAAVRPGYVCAVGSGNSINISSGSLHTRKLGLSFVANGTITVLGELATFQQSVEMTKVGR